MLYHVCERTLKSPFVISILVRLLKAMGWQEYPENDDNFLPLTEDELKEFQVKTEQVMLKNES